MRRALFSHAVMTAVFLFGVQTGCGPEGGDTPTAEVSAALHSGVVPNPPPASCDQRSKGVTAIQVQVRIDEYQGLIHGRNGDHEIAYGTVVSTPWVYDGSKVDTDNVQLALNVKSKKDPAGLPHEIRLSVGQVVEVEGEFIPAGRTTVHDKRGSAAVLHFTHAPCGYINIAGTHYN